MDFQSYLQQSADEINKKKGELLLHWRKNCIAINPKLERHIELFIANTHGGKCLRGVLVKLGYELRGHFVTEEVLTIAAAYEILHTSFLIHDDIIDQSIIRRGKPTLHKALGNNHYASSQAICLGDLRQVNLLILMLRKGKIHFFLPLLFRMLLQCRKKYLERIMVKEKYLLIIFV